MPLSSHLKVQCKSASLEEINKAQRHAPYLGVMCNLKKPKELAIQSKTK